MFSFRAVFPEIAGRETRTVFVLPAESAPNVVPPAGYTFEELYCEERRCDCRRVMINVYSLDTLAQVATINHAFEPPAADAHVTEQTFLDPLNAQSEWALNLMDLFVNTLTTDDEYRRRLIRHYHIFKNAINDAIHPVHRLLARADAAAAARQKSPRRSIPAPPPRRKKKRWS
jgi:hypothetical protein